MATLTSAVEFCAGLVQEATADRRAMTKHPFIQGIATGEVPLVQIAAFGTGMYRLVIDAQRWTAAGYSQCENQAERVLMLDSLVEEETGNESGTASHGELVVEFLQALGQSKAETVERSRRLGRRWQLYTEYSEFLGRCRPFWLYRGVSSLAGEAQFPALCRLMMEAMPKHYGIPESGLRFWSVHIPIDENHTSAAVKLVAPHLGDPEARRQLRDGVWSHMELRWQAYMEPMLDFAN
ncbi:MAG: iron-containing redox enzyme family protein [Acidimicrobiales bacterium]